MTMQKDSFASMNHSVASPELGFVVLATIPRVRYSMENACSAMVPHAQDSSKNSQKSPIDRDLLDVSTAFDCTKSTSRSAESSSCVPSHSTTETTKTFSEPLVLPGTPVFTVQAVSADTASTSDNLDSAHADSEPRCATSTTSRTTLTASRVLEKPHRSPCSQVVVARNLPESPRGRRRDWHVPVGIVVMLVVAFGVIHTIRQTIPEPIGPHSDLSQQIARSDAQKAKIQPQRSDSKVNLTELEPMDDFDSAVALPNRTEPTSSSPTPTHQATLTNVSSITSSTATQTASLPIVADTKPSTTSDAVAKTDLPILPGTGFSEITLPETTDASSEMAQNDLQISMTPTTTNVNEAKPLDLLGSRFAVSSQPESQSAEPLSDRFTTEPLPPATDRFAESKLDSESMLPLPNGTAIAANVSQTPPLTQPTDANAPSKSLPSLPAVPETAPVPAEVATETVPSPTIPPTSTDHAAPMDSPDYPDTGYVEIVLPTSEDTPAYPNTEHGEIVIPGL